MNGIVLMRWLRSGVGPVIGLAIVAYFVHFLIEGERGLAERYRLQVELQTAEATLGELEMNRAAWVAKVQALRPDSLDPDLLDEEARRALWLAEPGESVIPLR